MGWRGPEERLLTHPEIRGGFLEEDWMPALSFRGWGGDGWAESFSRCVPRREAGRGIRAKGAVNGPEGRDSDPRVTRL